MMRRFRTADKICLAALAAGIAPFSAVAQTTPPRGVPFQAQTERLPHRVFAGSRRDIDRELARPYDSEVPFGSSGDLVWATSPQGWGFGEGVNLLYFTNLNLFDITLNVNGSNVVVGRSEYYPSHIHMVGQPDSGERLSATASFTFTTDGVDRPLKKPFSPDKRWTCWSSGRREDWYAVNLGRSRNLTGVDLYFYDDQPVGGCAPPESVKVEGFRDGGWYEIGISPFTPQPNKNTLAFLNPERAEQLRFTFHHRGADKYTGLYGVKPHFGPDAGQPERAASRSNFTVTGDKWITQDDVLMTRISVVNASSQKLPLFIRMDSGLSAVLQGYSDERQIEGFPLYLRASGSDGRSRDVSFLADLKPKETRTFTFACAAAKTPETALANMNRGLSGQNALTEQTAAYQGWFDTNTAYFDCSDSRVAKMYYHRWYNVKKNSMNPHLGKLRHRAFAEGRWTADWYANVISYGAAHQIRESRWLRDPSYAWGHLQTFTENPRRDGIFPSHITPKGEQGGQYTDWITSTAWDAYLVHPDKGTLSQVADPLVNNAEGWRKVTGWNDSPLLVVDSHWWTGMEWQPSFFSFADYRTGGEAGEDRRYMTPLRRVDLTAYNYGNARAAARIMRELGREADADRMQRLADSTREEVLAQMWDPQTKWFHSLRASDNVKSPTREIIGLYPFYFDLPPKDKGYEAAWDSALDPRQFWTVWPLASVSLDCPAYAQNGWPVGPGGSICMWNGPSWPHANSIVMEGMANALRHYAPSAVSRQRLLDLFNTFTYVQFKNQNSRYPWTGEYYNGDTGEWKTLQRDYNHSTWIDPLIGDLIGLVPRNDSLLEVDSLLPESAWSHYLLDGQSYRGHDVTIAWDARGGKIATGFKGYAVYLDGKEIFHSNHPAHLLYDMAKRQRVTSAP